MDMDFFSPYVTASNTIYLPDVTVFTFHLPKITITMVHLGFT